MDVVEKGTESIMIAMMRLRRRLEDEEASDCYTQSPLRPLDTSNSQAPRLAWFASFQYISVTLNAV